MVFAPKKPKKPSFGASSAGARSTDTLLEQSQSWEESRIAVLEKSEDRAWKVARVMAAIAILAVTALAVLVPFYKIIPVVFRVDSLTDQILEVQVGKANVPQSEAMDKHWLAQYVQTRERYIWTLLQVDFDSTLALSDDSVAADYKAIYDGPNALDKKLGEGTDIRVKIVSVELIPGAPGKAAVTWERTMRQKGIDVEKGKRFVSTISYKYAPPEALTREKHLIANPFGFKVDGYAVATVNAGFAKASAEGGKP